MNSQRPARLSYAESCRLLQQHRHLDRGAIPPLLDHRPTVFGSKGVIFFRTWVGYGRPDGLAVGDTWEDVPEHSLDNLTLPRTFFGRSEIGPISFRNTDLSESTLCWNDFIAVDFTEADLSESDLRASIFRGVAFVRTNLRNADLRRSSFPECDFSEAEMTGAKLTRNQGERVRLSDEQRSVIDWQEADGEEPPGG